MVIVMTIKHLQIFAAVYRTQNITKAAEALFMPQPAVTRAIKELENHYGTLLFERLKRGVTPTEAGHQMYRRAVGILENIEQLNSELTDWDNIGIIRLGATISLGNYLLPEIVEKLKYVRPNLQVKVYVENAQKLHQRLIHNEVDLCFIEGMIPDNDLVLKPFAKDRIVLVVPVSKEWTDVTEITLDELAKLPFCTRQQGSISRRYAEEIFMQCGLVPNIVAESESTQSIIRLVSHGMGFSLLPEIMVQREIQDGLIRTIPLRDAQLVRTNYIVWHKDKYLTKIMQEIISWKNESDSAENTPNQA